MKTLNKTVIKTFVAAALVSATYATMAMDITNVQAKQELALHSQEKVQTMAQNMEKAQVVEQLAEQTQTMQQSQNRVVAELDVKTTENKAVSNAEKPVDTESSTATEQKTEAGAGSEEATN